MAGFPGASWLVAWAVAGSSPVLAPVLDVEAPRDTRKVTAHFPFGVSKELALDGRSRRWRGRVVVAGGAVPEGLYPVSLVVEGRDGARVVRREQVALGSAAAPFDARFAEVVVAPGAIAELHVDTVEPASAVRASCAALGWRDVPLGPSTDGDPLDWAALRTVPARVPPGDYAVTVTVVDGEGHALTRDVVLRVARARPA